MSDQPSAKRPRPLTRRALLGASSIVALTPGFGSTDAVAGEDTSRSTPTADAEQRIRGWMEIDSFKTDAIFRVESPPIDETPLLEERAEVDPQDGTARVIKYFNTGEESLLYLPSVVNVEQGAFYQLAGEYTLIDDEAGPKLVEVHVERYHDQDLAIDLSEGEVLTQPGSGGEAAVRPRDFSAGAIFRITSDSSLGWVPPDVAQSGYFTDYDTYRAAYIGTEESFLFFPQEGARVQSDVLYAMRDEFELFTPEGNLVAAEFQRVAEESLPAGDYLP